MERKKCFFHRTDKIFYKKKDPYRKNIVFNIIKKILNIIKNLHNYIKKNLVEDEPVPFEIKDVVRIRAEEKFAKYYECLEELGEYAIHLFFPIN